MACMAPLAMGTARTRKDQLRLSVLRQVSECPDDRAAVSSLVGWLLVHARESLTITHAWPGGFRWTGRRANVILV